MPCLLLNIIGDTSKRIRGLITAQGVERYSSYDFMEVACRSKDKTGASSRNAFKRLIAEESKFKNEILELTEYIRFPGAKQETPTMTLRGLQRLLMILGGRVATDYRKLMESTFTRVMGGDTSLVEIIEANAASTEPVQQAFKRALAQEPVEPVLDDMCKRHKKDLAELDILERKKAIQAKEMSNFKTWKELMDSVEPNWLKDQRLKLQTEDHLKNLLFNAQNTLALPNTPALLEVPDQPPLQSISIGQVIRDLGFSYSQTDLIPIGKMTAKAYRDAHSKDPPKHRQWVDGCERNVNSYTERDRALMENAVRRYFNDE